MKLKIAANPKGYVPGVSLSMMGVDPDLPPGVAPKYKSQQEIQAAIAFDEDFNKRHNLLPGIGLSTGKKIGDPVVQFRTLDGKPYVPNQMPASKINNSVPDWVQELNWDNNWQMPYYLDGDEMKFVKKDFYNSPRFRKNVLIRSKK